MTETEKAALERRIDELCSEVEKYRSARDASVDLATKTIDRIKELEAEVERGKAEFKKMDVWHSQELKAAMDENAKLRELARQLLDEYRYMHVRPRRMYLEHETRMRIIEDEMRELGIEVPA